MIILMKIFTIVLLFIIVETTIYKIIGIRKRKEIFNKINSKEGIETKISTNKKVYLNVLLFICVFIFALLNGYGVVMATLIGSFLVAILNWAKIMKIKACKKQILQDLLNITECLRVQSSAQVPLDKTLRSLPELCKNKEFGELLTNIYLEYELSKYVIIDSAKALQKRFDYPEIRIFISSLNQQIQGTSALEAFDNLINILKEKYIDFLEEATKNKMAILTLGVFIIVINIAAIGIYPVMVEVFNAMNTILK